MAYQIEWARNSAYGNFSGLANFLEVMQVVQTMHVHPDYDQFRYIMLDFAKVTRFDNNLVNSIEFLAHMIGASVTNPKLKIAIVTTDDNILELANELQTHAQINMKVFTSPNEAYEWAGVTQF
jgi:hypothetical protein